MRKRSKAMSSVAREALLFELHHAHKRSYGTFARVVPVNDGSKDVAIPGHLAARENLNQHAIARILRAG
jgi:hypothetical protein